MLITKFGVSPESIADNGDLPVHSACRAGCDAVLEVLVGKYGADVNAHN